MLRLNSSYPTVPSHINFFFAFSSVICDNISTLLF